MRLYGILLLGLALASPAALAMRRGCRAAVAGVPGPYEAAARKAGLRYLMATVPITKYGELLAKVVGRRDPSIARFPATASGAILSTPEGWLWRPLEGRFDFALRPLLAGHQGLWANYLIRGGDSIGMGVRTTSTFDWEVGLVFELAVLDAHRFVLEDTSTVDARRRRIGTGLGDVTFDSAEGTPEAFEPVVAERAKRDTERGGWYDANVNFSFQFPAGLPVGELRFLWIPRPLGTWMKEHPDAAFQIPPGTMRYELKDPYPPVSYRISRPVGDGWEQLVPPGPRADETFDIERRVGTWYTVVPDWAQVERQLGEMDKRP